MLSEEDALRADQYGLLGKLLFSAPDTEIISALSKLEGDETEMGRAYNLLAKSARNAELTRIQDEYDRLFIGLGRGELLPYGSYYLTGFLNEKPLANVRGSLRKIGVERANNVREPEDHIGFLMEVMAGLILGRFGAPAPIEVQRRFFAHHIEPWARHFFSDLETTGSAVFYRPIGTIGRVFVTIEADAFAMA